MSKNIYQISEIAATWWADVVLNPKFDNGDDSEIGFMGNMLQTMGVKEVKDNIRTKFLKCLSQTIQIQLRTQSYTLNIGTDYAPDRILRESAEYADLPISNFPIKTDMWVSNNHVAVSYGYGAKIEYLYTNKKFWSKDITSLEECIKGYDKGIEYYTWLTESDIVERITGLKKQITESQVKMGLAED